MKPSVAIVTLSLVASALALGAQSEGQTLLGEGTWTAGNYEIAGGWRLVEEEGERILIFDEDFRTRRAPDLKIFLSPLALDEIDDHNATEGSFLVARLARPRGPQRYPLPDEIVLDDFASLIIHCERFSKYWGGTALVVSSTEEETSGP